jgi:DNA ligase 4
MNMLELKWITKIILRDLKLGIGHESIFKMYHRHALDIFNATSDLKAVFE